MEIIKKENTEKITMQNQMQNQIPSAEATSKEELKEEIMKPKGGETEINDHKNQINASNQKESNPTKNINITKLRAYKRMLKSKKFLVRLEALRILKAKSEYIQNLMTEIKNLEEDEHPVVKFYAEKIIKNMERNQNEERTNKN